MTVTIHFHIELRALVFLLVAGYCALLFRWAADQIGLGPDYTTRENVAGSVAFLSGLACIVFIVMAVAVLVGRPA